MSKLRLPPQDLDAEKAVLGSVLVRQNAIFDIAEILTPQAFYSDKHKAIYEVMLEMSMKSEPIDVLSLTTRLKDKKLLDQIGGAPYLADLANSVPSATNVNYYAGIVERKYVYRELTKVADYIADLGYGEHEHSTEATLDMAEKYLLEMKARPQTKQYVSMKHAVSDAFERFAHLQENKDELRGVPTGFQNLDNMLSGLQPSDLIILAARPSVGKTTFALDLVRHAAVHKQIPVAFFSLEMSSQQLVDRMLSADAQLNSWALRTGNLQKQSEFDLLRESVDRLAKAPIFIDDQAGSNLIRIRSIVRRLKKEHGVGLIVIDYLQLMSPIKNYDSMVNQVTEISRGLKGLAKEFNVPVLALSQLSRAVESRGGEPRLSDLRDSGSIEQDADVVMFLHRKEQAPGEERGDVRDVKVIIGKHRNGPIGTVYMALDGRSTRFIEQSNEYAAMAEAQQYSAKKNNYDLSDI